MRMRSTNRLPVAYREVILPNYQGENIANFVVNKHGERGGTRTLDPMIKSHLLYRRARAKFTSEKGLAGTWPLNRLVASREEAAGVSCPSALSPREIVDAGHLSCFRSVSGASKPVSSQREIKDARNCSLSLSLAVGGIVTAAKNGID